VLLREPPAHFAPAPKVLRANKEGLRREALSGENLVWCGPPWTSGVNVSTENGEKRDENQTRPPTILYNQQLHLVQHPHIINMLLGQNN